MTPLLFLKEIDDRLEISQVFNPQYSIVKLEQSGRVAERERGTDVRLFLFRRFVTGLLQSEPNSNRVPGYSWFASWTTHPLFLSHYFEQKHKPSSPSSTTTTGFTNPTTL